MHPTPFYHKSRSIAQVEGTEATTSSSSSISHRLNDLQDLQENTDKLLQLRIFQQALAQECSNKQIDELLVIRRKRDAETGFTIEGGKYLACRKNIKRQLRKPLET
ncbi:hypothetical protein D0Y65_013410 [Glycine soja]|uniref:Uncharacterized protein n=1 Tax=Glycine soja TaxID=3848 RepID=A0A445K320_GLYSO|nr:hypothetical protein D0Y65_013410 [Glycine soja]RZC05220.1 hypothetical protein D0Y65_013410 [Glycine soja]